MPITFNLLLTDLDKDRFFKGEKGTYANLVLWETKGRSAEFGDYLVKQQGEEGDRMPILGNAKYWDPNKRRSRPQQRGGGRYEGRRRDEDYGRPKSHAQPPHGAGGGVDDDDEIPF